MAHSLIAAKIHGISDEKVAAIWEYQTSGLCGFETDVDKPPGQADLFGVWHTGDGNPATPGGTSTACADHAVAADPSTPAGSEGFQDILLSPIVAKVHQVADNRGYPFAVEFQRVGLNFTSQLDRDYTGARSALDWDIDDDNPVSLLSQYAYMTSGWATGDIWLGSPSQYWAFDASLCSGKAPRNFWKVVMAFE